jgi:hypothetical protein
MRNSLKNILLVTGLAAALGGATTASAGEVLQVPTNDYAGPARLDNAVSLAGQAGQFEKTQFFYGGRNYCWYGGGWHGAGYYWCGYAWHRGYGWGGPIGWRGWGRGGWHDHGGWDHGHGGWDHGGHGGWDHGGHDGGHHHH